VLCGINKGILAPDKFLNWLQGTNSSATEATGFPIKFDDKKVAAGNFLIMNENLVTVSNTSLMIFSGAAKKLNEIQHSFSNPMLKLGEKNILFYDLRGKNFQIVKNLNDVSTGNLEENIITAAISSNGIYGFITETNGYFSKMSIFSKNKEQIYKYYFSNDFINGLALNKDGDLAAVVGISAENGRMKSTLYVFDYHSSTPKLKYEFPDTIFEAIEFLSNGNVVAVGNKLTTVVDVFAATRYDHSYKDMPLTSFEIYKDHGAVLSLATNYNKGNCKLEVLGLDGHPNQEIFTNLNIKSVSCNGSHVAALSEKQVTIFNIRGEKLNTWNTICHTQQLRLCSGNCYLLGESEICKLNF
jgi:hypothetical protein